MSGHDGEVSFWDADLWHPLEINVPFNKKAICALTYEVNGDRLGLGTNFGVVAVCRRRPFAVLFQLQLESKKGSMFLAFTPDGRYLDLAIPDAQLRPIMVRLDLETRQFIPPGGPESRIVPYWLVATNEDFGELLRAPSPVPVFSDQVDSA